MHRIKASRIRVLVPSALAVVILTGAAAPSGAVEGAGAGAAASRVAAAQEEINERVAAAGPVEDALAAVSKILADLTKSLGTLLPGLNIPEIKLPALPAMPAIPAIPNLPIPAIPGIPEIPTIPVPEIPALPVSNPAAPPAGAVPAVPAVPGVPATLPAVDIVPEIAFPDFLP